MTKSTITREQRKNEVKELIANAEEWAGYYEHPIHDKPQREMFEGMARVMAEHLAALTAMDNEPVAYIFKHPAGRLFWSLTDESNKGHDDVMPVYASPQPAPIVEREPIAWLNDAYLARGVVDGEAGSEDAGPGYIPVYRHAQPAPVVPAVSDDIGEIRVGRLPTMNQDDYPGLGDWWVQLRIGEDSDEVLARVYGAAPQEANNRAEALACRAAMLAAAPQSPGSEPATVPGKWIPVSEQMPEDEQEVLTINKMAHRFVSFFDKHSGLFFDRLDAPAACCIEHVLVTHWMPLPAAPQEVKGE